MRLFRQGLASGTRVREIEDSFGALKAVEQVLRGSRPGDLLVIQADDIDTTMNFIQSYLERHPEGREIGLTEAIASGERDAVVVFARLMD